MFEEVNSVPVYMDQKGNGDWLFMLQNDIKSIKKNIKNWTKLFTQIMELTIQNSRQNQYNTELLTEIIHNMQCKKQSISPIARTEPDEDREISRILQQKKMSIMHFQGTPFDSAYESINREMELEPKKKDDKENQCVTTNRKIVAKKQFNPKLQTVLEESMQYKQLQISTPKHQGANSCSNKATYLIEFPQQPMSSKTPNGTKPVNYFIENSQRSGSKSLYQNQQIKLPQQTINFKQQFELMSQRAKSYSEQNYKKKKNTEPDTYENSQEILRKKRV